MAPTDKKTIPIAYVTTWAKSAGIVVVRNAEFARDSATCLHVRTSVIPPEEWTTDRREAERRWHEAMHTAARTTFAKANAVREKAIRLRKAATEPPPYCDAESFRMSTGGDGGVEGA